MSKKLREQFVKETGKSPADWEMDSPVFHPKYVEWLEAKAGQHEPIVMPQNESEKQAFFIVTVMRNMNKDEVEMLCENLLARYDINLPRLIQCVEQIKDVL